MHSRRRTEGSAQFVWADIEDDEQVLGGIDIFDFPILLIAEGDNIFFVGRVTLYPETGRGPGGVRLSNVV